MVDKFTSYIVENDEVIAKHFEDAAKKVSDLRIPFTLIARDFFISNRAIFKLKGPGKYPDFKNERSRKSKIAAVGFDYPLMVRSGRLASSLTNGEDGEAVKFIGKKTLELGTKVPYTIYHQSDEPRTVLPQRKVVFIDGGPLETSRGASTSGRRDRWTSIIDKYVMDVTLKV